MPKHIELLPIKPANTYLIIKCNFLKSELKGYFTATNLDTEININKNREFSIANDVMTPQNLQ